MRFKNLTITTTLGVLSIVAVAGLALLPITNGVCNGEFYENDWKYSNDNTQASYNAKHYGSYWALYASVDARVVNASVSVSPFELSDWQEADRLEGTATVTAHRDPYVKHLIYHCNQYHCSSWHFGMCWGHYAVMIVNGSEATDTNERSPDVSQGDSLILDVQIREHTKTVAKARSKKENREVEITIGYDLELPKGGKFDIGTKGAYKNEILRSTSESWQVTGVKKPFESENVGRYVEVVRRPSLRLHERLAVESYGTTSAEADFSFYEADSEALVVD